MTDDDANKMAHATEDALANTEGEDLRRAQSQVDEHAQRGVQNVEAVTLTWTKSTLILVFLK